jgi:cobalt/nickel transport system ATP-binding protein
MNDNKSVIIIRSLDFFYPDGRQALKDIDLDVFEGETLGIIGANGAGKTTLLLHMNGILQGSANMSVLDMQMNKRNLRAIRSKVGMVFQNPDDQLFSPTVFDDVAFAPLNLDLSKGEVEERVKAALNQVDMAHYENMFPHHLSMGEKKKISVATVLSTMCGILVLDEPTANLDPRSRKNIIELLKQLKVTKIVAGHDMELVMDICTRVVVMDHGKIVAAGKPREILLNKLLMEQHGLEAPSFLF